MLSEISTFNKTQASTATASTSPTTSRDSVGVSQFAQVMQQLQQLQTSNPAEFKQVMSDAASQLKTAAAQATNPAQATFLTDLSDRFQKAADTGNLSALQPQNSASGTYVRHGHHGHHHAAASTDTDSATTTPADPATLLSQMLSKTQSGTNGQATAQTQSQSLIASFFSSMQ